MKTCSTRFLAIVNMVILLTNRWSTKNSLLWQEILMMFLSAPQPLKPLANIFFPHRYIYLVIRRLQVYYMDLLHADLLHGNCLLTGFNFSIKILLAKMTFCFELRYVICPICRRSILVVFLDVVLLFRFPAALHMFLYSVAFRLFCQYSVVPPVFLCSAGVIEITLIM